MSDSGEGSLTLTVAQLAAAKPVESQGGEVIRAFCPFHGGDHQRSLRLTVATGRFKCFQCGAWGYTEEARERWRTEDGQQRETHCWACGEPIDSGHDDTCEVCGWMTCPRCGACADPRQVPGGCRPPQAGEVKAGIRRMVPGGGSAAGAGSPVVRLPAPSPEPVRTDLSALIDDYGRGLDSRLGRTLGQGYLRRRSIPLDLARSLGIGYAAPDKWAHVKDGRPVRRWKWGRIVFPHTRPDGMVINLYGRAVDNERAPARDLRHDHLPGHTGYFNAVALREGPGPLFVCEGAFDAASLIVAGHQRTVAIFGVNGWRWDWARDVNDIVLALDADTAGQASWLQLARAGCLRGKAMSVLPPEALGGYKDVNEAWAGGVLDLSDLATWPTSGDDDAEERLAIQQEGSVLWRPATNGMMA